MSLDCGSSTTLILSREQAALLMPLLQQMTQNSPAVDDGKGKNATDLTDHHQMSSQPAKFGVDQPTKDSDDARLANESTEEINSEGDAFLDSFSYSVQELLCKKKRNQKSTLKPSAILVYVINIQYFIN